MTCLGYGSWRAGSLLSIEYGTRPDGARVTFTGTDPGVVTALHYWFDAQLSDHAGDAERG